MLPPRRGSPERDPIRPCRRRIERRRTTISRAPGLIRPPMIELRGEVAYQGQIVLSARDLRRDGLTLGPLDGDLLPELLHLRPQRRHLDGQRASSGQRLAETADERDDALAAAQGK